VQVRYKELNTTHKCCVGVIQDYTKAKIKDTRIATEKLRKYTLKPGEDIRDVVSMTAEIVSFVDGVAKFHCGYCFKEFPKPRLLNKHLGDAHDGLKYRCDICPDYRASAIARVVFHKKSRHDIVEDTHKWFDCTLCPFKTISEGKLKEHVQNKHSKNVEDRTCKVCNKVLASPHVVRYHVRTVHMKMKMFACKECPMTFKSHGPLKVHRWEAHGLGEAPVVDTPAVCSICGATCKSKKLLELHVKNAHVDGPITCKVCGKVMKNKGSYKSHMQVRHSTSQAIKCPDCAVVFENKFKMYLHNAKVHRNLQPFGCKTCGGAFRASKECAMHIALQHERWSKDFAEKNYKQIVNESPAFIKNDIKPISMAESE